MLRSLARYCTGEPHLLHGSRCCLIATSLVQPGIVHGCTLWATNANRCGPTIRAHGLDGKRVLTVVVARFVALAGALGRMDAARAGNFEAARYRAALTPP